MAVASPNSPVFFEGRVPSVDSRFGVLPKFRPMASLAACSAADRPRRLKDSWIALLALVSVADLRPCYAARMSLSVVTEALLGCEECLSSSVRLCLPRPEPDVSCNPAGFPKELSMNSLRPCCPTVVPRFR